MKKILSVFLALIMTAAVFSASGVTVFAKLPGDANGDGKLNNKDVVTLFRYVSGKTEGAVAENCDFNGDGKTNNKDVVALFKALTEGTLPPVEKEETVLIDFNTEKGAKAVSFFARESYCSASSATDEEAGGVLTIKTKNVSSPNKFSPVIYFRYGDYSESIGEKCADFKNRPYVVMKIRTVDINDRLFRLTGMESYNGSALTANEASVKIPGGDEWRYICFDFTPAKTPEKFNAFRISFEQFAGRIGEMLMISEIRICTQEEAAGYITADVYPIEDQTAQDYAVKVMQFNIQTENGNSAPFIARSEMYRQLIDELRPDVVGMQEATPGWRSWLDTYVFNDSYEGVGEARTTDPSLGLESNPIYYRKDKFELVESGTFWLSDTPDVVGSTIEIEVDGVKYTANYPRICTWVHLRDKTTGVEFVHFNTHLDHNGSNNSTNGNTIRKKEMGVIIKFAQRFKGMPTFLTGDLNNKRTTGEGKTYALIKYIQGDSKFKDTDGTEYTIKLSDARLNAPVTVDENHTATMTKYYDETGSAYEPMREPIDYVFYDPANTSPLTYETFLFSNNGVWISDHLPVFTTFLINAAE